MQQLAFTIRTAIVAIALGLMACQPAPQPQIPASAPAPEHKHAHATRYAIDAERSTVVLRVYRDGALARFGHNHVITATQLRGTIFREANIAQSDVELSFPAAGLLVDSADDRAQAGADFPGVLPPEAIAGTRQHMLGPQLLAAEQYPQIMLRTIAVSGQWPELQLIVEIKLREFTSQLPLSVHMTELENTLIADGAVSLSQVQLGLKPYSVLGGGLRVADKIDAQFHLIAAHDSSQN
ncbi:MAG TPA: YceI family protein [Spongiibacteraceae bacterium]